ncbi:DUF6000 family protein [Streptomyces sp. NPDC086777]|uniref:DUF6000 family protein n=1 Tax=Streptomyces sp. NPDC086777 TaxID=3154866 RepID=UPI0034502AB6
MPRAGARVRQADGPGRFAVRSPYEWRSRLTAAWLIGVDRRASFRERLGDFLLAGEVCQSGSAFCFALARLGTHADAEILTARLDHYFPRTDLRSSDCAANGPRRRHTWRQPWSVVWKRRRIVL